MKKIFSVLFVFFWIGSFAFVLMAKPGENKDTASAQQPPVKPIPLAPQDMFASCARCHSIGKGKLIGPDLLGMAERHSEKWLVNFIHSSDSVIKSGDTAAIRLYKAYDSLPMPYHDFNYEETKSLIEFIRTEGNKLKADPDFLDNSFSFAPPPGNWMFIFGLFLIILSVVDLFFTKFIKYKILHIVLLFIGTGVVGKIMAQEAINLGRSPGYEPDQPIKFSHKIHAGENKIACDYCHTGVTKSRYASIPPASMCLNCHNVIRSGLNTGETEIDKIHKYVEEGKPVAWIKVHNLPDHVFFSHAQHVAVGKIECKTCHGDVANMGRIQQVTDLSMGWCITCHRDTKVNFDNKYYSSYKQHEELNSGKISKVTVDDIGGNNCQKCHY